MPSTSPDRHALVRRPPGPAAYDAPLLTLLLFLVAAAGARPADDIDAPTRNWRSGPVRYLLTGREDQIYKSLTSDAERAAFIRAFWARRDPTPDTRRNEYRERFLDRVRATEGLRRYQEVSKAQWMTDPGKYLILLGPPMAEEHSQVAGSTRDTVVWTYDEVPGVRERNFSIAFVADESGELRLSESPSLDMATTQGLASHTPLGFFELPSFRGQEVASSLGADDGTAVPPDAAGDDSSAPAGRGGGESGESGDAAPATDRPAPQGAGVGGPGRTLTTLGRATALGDASTFAAVAQAESVMGPAVGNLPQFLPLVGSGAFLGDPLLASLGAPTSQTGLGRLSGLAGLQGGRPASARTAVDVRTSFEPVGIDLRSDFYAAADGTTYAAFTLSPSHAAPAGSGWVPFGGMVSLDREEVAFSFASAEQFAPAGADAPDTFQTGLGVDPGRYRVLFGLRDGGSGRFGYRQVEISVPDLSRGLELSSLTLARSIAPAPGGPAPTPWKIPYVLGTLRVVPRPDPVLRNGEEFDLYYQVYGATAGADGRPSLAIRYSFARAVGDDWQAIGRPIEQQGTTAAQAWAFPLNRWPPGRFRLAVEVRDRLASQVVQGALEFSVAE